LVRNSSHWSPSKHRIVKIGSIEIRFDQNLDSFYFQS